jgi:serine/threonine-protein kinase RsbW
MKAHIKKEKNAKSIELKLNLPANPIYIGEVRERVSEACGHACLADEDTQDICLAVVEAVTNAIRHSGCDEFAVLLTLSSDRAVAKIIDNGRGFIFNKSNCSFPEADSPGGRGLPIICSLVDNLTVDSNMNSGTIVTIVKYLGDNQVSA